MMEVFECTLEQSMSASGKTSDAVVAIGTLVTILEIEAASLNRIRAEREQRTTDRRKENERRAKEKERRTETRAQREERKERRASAQAQYSKLLQETLHARAWK
jgi:hypothetical protein